MIQKRLLLFFCQVLIMYYVFAQETSNVKFGNITAADFNNPALKFDSSAGVVIIADVGSTRFEGNSRGSFNTVFTRFMRVKIINKNGFEIGNQQISLFHGYGGESEKLSSLKASTFNIENGTISESKLDEKSVYDIKFNNRFNEKKFSLPALKEGSIFDLEYSIWSPFIFRLTPWSFQGNYPKLWSEYTVIIPPPLNYVVKLQGDNKFFIDTTKEVFILYNVSPGSGIYSDKKFNIRENSICRKWVKKNVPALHEEAFTTSLNNYYSRVTFQLSYVQWDKHADRREILSNWNEISKELLAEEDFGISLNRDNGWMSEELDGILVGAKSDEDKAKKIFIYIRDHFKAPKKNGYGSRGLYTHQSLKDLFRKREGNVAEINLLLTAMMRKAGFKADPVILSTRDNGFANPSYPLLSEYNYVICDVLVNDRKVTLDASRPYSQYGQLPILCYNGWAYLINEEKPMPLYFSTDSVLESSITNVIIINDKKGLSGGFTKTFGRNESADIREEITGSSEKEYEKKILTASGSDFNIENFRIDSVKMPEIPMVLHFDFEPKNLAFEDILYFNPMLNEGYKTNPFKSMTRHYPVEMPYTMDDNYILNMEIPKGYVIDEIPKSARIALNENEGMFEYLIQKGETNIQMRVRLKLNKTNFTIEDYGTLRDFFTYVVNKEGEQIVFKKIK